MTTYRRNSTAKTGRELLFYLAIAVGIIGCVWNMMPYIRVATATLTTVFGVDPGLLGVIQGRFFGMLGIGVGFFLWAFLQILETYPVFLRHDAKVLRLLAETSDNAPKLEEKESDDRTLRKIKHWYNTLPLVGFRTASRGALVAYGIDAVICITQHPPVEGGFGNLLFVLVTGQWGLISWSNVALIVVMMFLCETILRLVLYLGIQAEILKAAHAK